MQEAAEKKELNSPGGPELLKSLGGTDSLPFFAFLDCEGSMIVNSIEPPKDGKKGGGNIGHPNAPHEVDWFMVMLDKAVPKMPLEERATLEYWLRHQ